jgi:hypothetical protein
MTWIALPRPSKPPSGNRHDFVGWVAGQNDRPHSQFSATRRTVKLGLAFHIWGPSGGPEFAHAVVHLALVFS